MTLPSALNRPRPLGRTLSVALLALVGTIASFGVTTAPAEAVSSHYYRAQLAMPVSESTTDIQRGVRWICADETCVAPHKARSRAKHVCKRLESKFGEVTAFRAGGEQFDADALADCNS